MSDMLTSLDINWRRVHAALTRFVEATEADKRDRKLASDARELEAVFSDAFIEQGETLIADMERYRNEFVEAALTERLKYSEWIKTLTKSEKAFLERVVGPLEEAIMEAMIMGSDDLFGLMDWGQVDDGLMQTAFDVVNEEAIQYANKHAASQVTKITETTRERLWLQITHAMDNGWSYDRLADEITSQFADMSEGRARRIAVYELRDAYEGGQRELVEQVQKRGLDMETYWLTAGDERVRDSHRASQGEGWQDVGYTFASGSDRSPSDPGCRCTMLYRRKK